ncbi:uncharacterized protein TNCV_2409671 [Trichonephila clavipes]|nr:uncharacterized protein TNCV_2409671 [Trichonephila clavipes]
MSSSPVPLKTSRVGERSKLNSSRAQTSSLWCGVLWLFPALGESEPDNFIWQQDGGMPHWHLSVCDWLNVTVPNQWISCKGPHDKACFATPPRSPVLTPCNFYLGGLIDDCEYVPPARHKTQGSFTCRIIVRHGTVDFPHLENPSTWAGVEPTTLDIEGQRQANHITRPT